MDKGKNSNRNSTNKKKCNNCGRFNLGMEDCYSRMADKAPCYITKGEPNYPKGELEANQSGNDGTFKPAAPLSTAKLWIFPIGSE